MERTLGFIPECDKKRMETCVHAPNCENLQRTKHHMLPRRLGKIALEAGASEEYQDLLKRVIRHPLNKLVVPRCIHDDLDAFTTDTLPGEEELKQRLEAWNGTEEQ